MVSPKVHSTNGLCLIVNPAVCPRSSDYRVLERLGIFVFVVQEEEHLYTRRCIQLTADTEHIFGEIPKRLKGAVLKTARSVIPTRGFESLSPRQHNIT